MKGSISFVDSVIHNKNNAFIQFLKYGFCGGVAFAVDTIVFYLLAITVFYSLTPDDLVVSLFGLKVSSISESLQARNFALGKVCSFMVSNTVAYILNVLYVFKPGKYKMRYEIMMFFGLSTIAFLLGLFAGSFLILAFGVQTTFSNITAIVSAILINYAGRKYLIFKG